MPCSIMTQPQPRAAAEDLRKASLDGSEATGAMGVREDTDIEELLHAQGGPFHSPRR